MNYAGQLMAIKLTFRLPSISKRGLESVSIVQIPLFRTCKNADIITAVWNSTTGILTVTDRWTTQNGLPPPDTSSNHTGCEDNILDVSGFQNASVSVARFSRLLNTGDIYCDYDLIPGPRNFIYAFGVGEKFFFHNNNAGYLRIDPFLNYTRNGTTSIMPSTGTSTSGFPTTSTGGSSPMNNESKLTANESIVIVIGVIITVLVIANIVAAMIIRQKRLANPISIDTQPLLISEESSKK